MSVHKHRQPKLVKANALLLALTFTLLIVVAFVPEPWRNILNKVLLSAIFITCIYALESGMRLLVPFVITLIVMKWTVLFTGSPALETAAGFIYPIFFIYVVVKCIHQFTRAGEVCPQTLLAAVNGYLLMGLLFSLLVMIISRVYSESYFVTHTGTYLMGHEVLQTYIYYTFVTMATVGYGDIVPVSAPARALTVFISASGPLYIAVVIAFLVGKYVGSQQQLPVRSGD